MLRLRPAPTVDRDATVLPRPRPGSAAGYPTAGCIRRRLVALTRAALARRTHIRCRRPCPRILVGYDPQPVGPGCRRPGDDALHARGAAVRPSAPHVERARRRPRE